MTIVDNVFFTHFSRRWSGVQAVPMSHRKVKVVFENDSCSQSLRILTWNIKAKVFLPFKYVVRDPGSSKVEDELNKKEGEGNETEPEKKENSLREELQVQSPKPEAVIPMMF